MMLIQSLIFVTRTNFFQMLTTVNSSFCQVSRELAAKECELRYATDNVERAKVRTNPVHACRVIYHNLWHPLVAIVIHIVSNH